jgi:hypothetical protein
MNKYNDENDYNEYNSMQFDLLEIILAFGISFLLVRLAFVIFS